MTAVAAHPLTVPFTVAIDSREQLPFAFRDLNADAVQRRRPLVIPTVRKALGIAGTRYSVDYSVVGFETQVAIERKDKADLWQTIAQHRRRFADKLGWLSRPYSTYEFVAVVVECEWSELMTAPPEYSQLPAKNVFRTVMCWQQQFRGVQWWFCPDRRFAEVVTFRMLERFWKVRQNKIRKRMRGATP